MDFRTRLLGLIAGELTAARQDPGGGRHAGAVVDLADNLGAAVAICAGGRADLIDEALAAVQVRIAAAASVAAAEVRQDGDATVRFDPCAEFAGQLHQRGECPHQAGLQALEARMAAVERHPSQAACSFLPEEQRFRGEARSSRLPQPPGGSTR